MPTLSSVNKVLAWYLLIFVNLTVIARWTIWKPSPKNLSYQRGGICGSKPHLGNWLCRLNGIRWLHACRRCCILTGMYFGKPNETRTRLFSNKKKSRILPVQVFGNAKWIPINRILLVYYPWILLTMSTSFSEQDASKELTDVSDFAGEKLSCPGSACCPVVAHVCLKMGNFSLRPESQHASSYRSSDNLQSLGFSGPIYGNSTGENYYKF